MAETSAAQRVDARGLKCPWPALRLARALRDGGGPVDILADDPAAAREIAAVAQGRGLTVTRLETDAGDGFRVG